MLFRSIGSNFFAQSTAINLSSMFRRLKALNRSAKLKYLAAALLVVSVLYSEWLVYAIQPYYWQDLKCNSQDGNCTKILFIADPQIQGEDAAPFPLNSLFIWDSDRYLKKTFLVTMQFFRPDVLIFMGDVMDEGADSKMPQYDRYVKRLADIFKTKYPIMQIWISGDNDIGGENEPVYKDKIEKFHNVYPEPNAVTYNNISFVTYNNISFYKVNGITYKIPKKLEGNNLSIVVSHYAITGMPVFRHKVNAALCPNIYFCAHDHKSKYVKQNKELKYREIYMLKFGDKILDVPLFKEPLYEIYIPTCSYRMGTSEIGYGVAIVEPNYGLLRYTVLWSPQRFSYFFFFYLVITSIIISYSCVFLLAKRFYANKNSVRNDEDEKVPFIQRI